MKIWILVVALVVIPFGRARADDGAARKQLVAEVVRALNAGDAKAFAATFADDGFVFLPIAAAEGEGKDAIAAATKRWLGALGPGKVTFKLEGAYHDAQWFDAQLVATPGGKLRMTGVFTSGEHGYKLGALHLSEAADDKAVLAAAGEGKLPQPPRLGSSSEGPSMDVRPDQIAQYADRLYGNTRVTVLGTASSERATGKAAVTRMLKGWKTLKLGLIDVKSMSDPGTQFLGWSVGHVEATFKVGARQVKVPYRVLMILHVPWSPEDDQKPELIAAHFSIATR